MTADPLPGYVLESTLGTGATGTVHLARKAEWADRLVAVKRVPCAATGTARALRHEAEVLAGLDHPHIVRILDLVRDGDGVAIAMQYAPGGSLAGLLDRRGRLSPGEVVALAAPLADALASAHRRGLLHCDVKPANVLFTSDGEALLSDFGLARRVAAPASGDLVGTAEYVDPEVVEGAAPDPRSDIYGLGAVCYELLAGHPPFGGATPAAVLASALAGDPVPLALSAPGAPPALAAAVERAMARRRVDRWPDATAFAGALRASVPPTPLRLDGPAPFPVGGAGSVPAPPPAEEAGSPRPVPAAAPGGRPPGAVPHRPTRTFGPRPPRPPAAPALTHRRPPAVRRLVFSAAAAAGVAVVVALAAVLPGGRRPAAAPVTATTAPAPPSRPVSWEGNVAEVEGTRYEMGLPGDVLLLGDWNCDGTPTPALYRPSTGRVYRFDAWATAGREVAATDGGQLPRHAVPTVAAGAGGCDRVAAAGAPGR